jgi:hypothetical protein
MWGECPSLFAQVIASAWVFECLEDAIPLFLDDIVHDSRPFLTAFGAGLNEDCRHVSLPDYRRSRRALHKAKGSNSCERTWPLLTLGPAMACDKVKLSSDSDQREF